MVEGKSPINHIFLTQKKALQDCPKSIHYGGAKCWNGIPVDRPVGMKFILEGWNEVRVKQRKWGRARGLAPGKMFGDHSL